MKRITSVFVCLVFFGFLAIAQDIQITGNVTNADDGTVIPGVSVVVKGTKQGTTTNVNGDYSLKAPADATLVFSFLGMKTTEVQVAGQTKLDLAMEMEATEMEEVVVTALGVQRMEKSLTYSVQQVNGEELIDSKDQNLLNTLSGRVAGVQVTGSSGAAGSSSRIVLRGASSIFGSSAPLFVVDGIPIDNTYYGTADNGGGYDMPNGAADINPENIENISVLQGGAAAALYGNRASNGVIIITTKSGKGAKGLGVSINSSVMFESPLRLPDFQNSYGQGPNRHYFEFVDGTNGDGDGVDESWGPPMDIGLNFVQWSDYETGAPSEWKSYKDNVKDMYQRGVSINNSVAFEGGNDKTSFYLSAANSNRTGIVYNTDYIRSNISGSATTKLSNKLSATFKANYISAKSNNLAEVGYTAENPIQQTLWSGRSVDLESLEDYQNLPLAAVGTAAEGTPINWNTQFQNNLYWVQDNNLTKMDKDRLIGSVKLDYQFTTWLSAFVRTGTDFWSERVADQKAVGSNQNPYGYYQEIQRKTYEMNSDFLITFNKKFGDIGTTLNAGGNRMKREYARVTGSLNGGIELPAVYNLSNIKSETTPSLTNYYEKEQINSLYFSGQLSYKDFIFLDLSGRQDWWSILPIDNNSYFYPGASMSFILSDIVDLGAAVRVLKFKAGWARVGSSGPLSPYELQQVFQYRATPWGSVALLNNPTRLNNPNIKPETSENIDLAAEGRFFGNKLRVLANYYIKKSKDLIIPVEVSASTGYVDAWSNAGEMKNHGIELQLGTTLIERGDFSIDINLNLATYNNEVVSLGDFDALTVGGQWNVTTEARVGKPYLVLVGPAFLRDSISGQIIHENGLPIVDETYQELGSTQPDWTAGLNFVLSYKGFSLSTLIDSKFGGDIYTMTYTWGRYSGVLEESLIGREVGIVGNGVKNTGTADNPVYVPNDIVVSAEDYNKKAFDNGVAESSVFDASYIKLRNLTLSYTLPNKWVSKARIEDVTIGFLGNNLALLYSRVPHIDPESAFSSEEAQQGLEFGQIPSVRSYGFNIGLKF